MGADRTADQKVKGNEGIKPGSGITEDALRPTNRQIPKSKNDSSKEVLRL